MTDSALRPFVSSLTSARAPDLEATIPRFCLPNYAGTTSAPCYLSFDIDGIDPSFSGGTDTLEVDGLTVSQALENVRGCRGPNLVDTDLVEVARPYDASGNTSPLGANLLYEMLCLLPGMPHR